MKFEKNKRSRQFTPTIVVEVVKCLDTKYHVITNTGFCGVERNINVYYNWYKSYFETGNEPIIIPDHGNRETVKL